MAKGVCITGSGIICAIGADKQSVYESLLRGDTGIGRMQYLESSHTELPVGEVKMTNSQLKSSLDIGTDEDISRTTLLGAYALKQAVSNSNIEKESLNKKRVTLISGTTVAGMDITERYYDRMIAGDKDAVEYVRQHDCGSNTNDIAALCSLECETVTISTACSSAMNAIILGVRMLLANETDIVFAGGAEALSRFHLCGFNSLMILDKEYCRPFDATRQGLNLGEGAAFIVLERSDDATLRGACIEAYIAGYGNRCDAFHQTASSSNGKGAFLAMSDALEMACVPASCIDYINAHGTGTPNNDASESAALVKLFGNDMPAVSSTKSYTGHTTSASGSIETVISLIAMHNSFIPANIHWKTKGEDCIVPHIGNERKKLHYVLCNSFGFGGNDSALLLSDKVMPIRIMEAEEHRIAGNCEITSVEKLSGLKNYLSGMELRRMGNLTKAAFLSSLQAMEAAGVDKPDAIIVATRFGMLENGEMILDHLNMHGENGISPTQFMQSTHNTLAGALAIKLKCHGYNITYSQGEESLAWALKDARKLISEGAAKCVLVGVYDELPQKFHNFYRLLGIGVPDNLYARSIILKV